MLNAVAAGDETDEARRQGTQSRVSLAAGVILPTRNADSHYNHQKSMQRPKRKPPCRLLLLVYANVSSVSL